MTRLETSRTLTHEYYISRSHYGEGIFEATFRPLNPKNGVPWQASHRIEDGADVQPANWPRPIAFSTIEAARAAIIRKQQERR